MGAGSSAHSGRERYDQTLDNAASAAYDLRSTDGIIAGAALIVVAVFGGFAAGDMVMFQQMGFGLGVAVLLDPSIVRSVIVPAGMKLLGDRNWHLPSLLEWLLRVEIEPEESAEAVARDGGTGWQGGMRGDSWKLTSLEFSVAWKERTWWTGQCSPVPMRSACTRSIPIRPS
jgi:hypothetical protein